MSHKKKLQQKKFLRDLELRHQTHQKTNVRSGAILAIDYGTKKCGFAYSPEGICAFPLEVTPTPAFKKRLKELINEKKITKIVWGLPQSDDGTISSLGKTIKIIAEENKSLAPYAFINERKSTQIAQAQNHPGAHPDAIAATIMLEWYLEKK